ncbi:hypothetical protein [Streptomyces sp. NBC_01549]|uniref:hypothetical protein n=1 Tax=Streptomyces sp. NBC_01549 TaxID=2975874 RepID=UPI002B1CC703|nr:hypothetical protein [Streptomyces sp. NBC_01549]
MAAAGRGPARSANRQPTLPVLLAYESADDHDRRRLTEIFRGVSLLDHAVDTKRATAVPVRGGQEERCLVWVVLEAVGVQRHAGVHRHALVRCAERSVAVQGQGEDLVDLWRGGPVRGVGLVRRVGEHRLQGLPVAGQQPPGDLCRRPRDVLGNGDAIGFLDRDEVVGLDARAVGGERVDDELVRVERPVGHVQPLVGRPVEHGVVGEDVLANDVLDVAGAPELLGAGELVRVLRVALILTGPGAGQAVGKADGESGQVGAG